VIATTTATRIGENIATNVSATEAITIAGITEVVMVVAPGSSFGTVKLGSESFVTEGSRCATA
jgi:hypothetical protein